MYFDEVSEGMVELDDSRTAFENNIILAKEGDKDTFISVIEEYKIDLYRMGRTILDSDDDIGDAMQETVLKAYKSLKNLKNLHSFKTWLIKIMVNECNNILRGKKKIVFLDKVFHKEESYTDDYNFDKQPVLKAIKKLESKFREPIFLYYYEDLSIKEISKCLDISEGTVKSRLSRARNKLFQLLKEVQE
ncbi:RNA polymerase sigma factor [Clostridium folliculivorans]|uniref:RNA polymerase subunit sigma-24 n=1 Tax=Clostridium folliculivorans TaxID=2886038 RepID=A0A9W6DC14_9CLOT|nr:sigma-70 family RNA polymerase sigma factor [Clostridium folliculivorans]GKU26521.1 RNA polymerase subunit sigma-24 [Clostridium folliculivorans]GKU29047.1 RNA polymerase subunit sigma-24 [Clostridium folliculivorans]